MSDTTPKDLLACVTPQERLLNDLGPLPPVPKEERRYVGASSIPTIYEVFKPHVATLPTGERVELPAGTVLREGTLPPEAEDDRPTLGEQLHDEHDRVGPPREMAPSVAFLDGFNEGMKAAQAEAAGGMATSTIAEALRLAIGASGDPPLAPAPPPNTVREEDETGVRYVDRSQAMTDRNLRALTTWNIDGTRYDLPVPPAGSGCRVYSCWTPCAPEHHYCALHGGADAVPPTKART